MPVIIVQEWEEREHGWGVRPDGYTLHASVAACAAAVDARLRRQAEYYTKRGVIGAPDEYTTTSGAAQPRDVSQAVVDAVVAAGPEGLYTSSVDAAIAAIAAKAKPAKAKRR